MVYVIRLCRPPDKQNITSNYKKTWESILLPSHNPGLSHRPSSSERATQKPTLIWIQNEHTEHADKFSAAAHSSMYIIPIGVYCCVDP